MSWSIEAVEAVGATYAKPLEDDLGYATIPVLLERLWLRCAPGSYTVAAFRQNVVKTMAEFF